MIYYRMMMGVMLDTPGPVFRMDRSAGTAERWDEVQRAWVSVDYFPLHREIGNGAIDLDKVTFAESGLPEIAAEDAVPLTSVR